MIPLPDEQKEAEIIDGAFPGWLSHRLEYPLGPDVRQALCRNDLDLSCQLTRCRPDFQVFPPEATGFPSFFAEVKEESRLYDNCVVEAVSYYVLRKIMDACGAKIMLVLQASDGTFRGQWFRDILPTRDIYVPVSRWPHASIPSLRDTLYRLGYRDNFGKFKSLSIRNGSGDPFIKICAQEWQEWPEMPADVSSLLGSPRRVAPTNILTCADDDLIPF